MVASTCLIASSLKLFLVFLLGFLKIGFCGRFQKLERGCLIRRWMSFTVVRVFSLVFISVTVLGL